MYLPFHLDRRKTKRARGASAGLQKSNALPTSGKKYSPLRGKGGKSPASLQNRAISSHIGEETPPLWETTIASQRVGGASKPGTLSASGKNASLVGNVNHFAVHQCVFKNEHSLRVGEKRLSYGKRKPLRGASVRLQNRAISPRRGEAPPLRETTIASQRVGAASKTEQSPSAGKSASLVGNEDRLAMRQCVFKNCAISSRVGEEAAPPLRETVIAPAAAP